MGGAVEAAGVVEGPGVGAMVVKGVVGAVGSGVTPGSFHTQLPLPALASESKHHI